MIFYDRFLKILEYVKVSNQGMSHAVGKLVIDRMALKMKYVLACYFWYSYYDEENKKKFKSD